MPVIETLARVLTPWSDRYSSSTAVSTTVTTVHVVSLLISGGLAIAADRSVLRMLGRPDADRMHALEELSDVHRPVLAALAVLIVSGFLLAAADIKTFATSTLFWFKMGLVVLLMVNGMLMVRRERRLAMPQTLTDPRWRVLGWHARASLTLWLCIAVAGTVMTNAG